MHNRILTAAVALVAGVGLTLTLAVPAGQAASSDGAAATTGAALPRSGASEQLATMAGKGDPVPGLAIGNPGLPSRTADPVYAHLPYGPGIGRTDWPAQTRERIDAGWATGAFLYYSAGDALDWGPEWDAFVAEFPKGVDLMVSPKTIDEDKLVDFLDRLPDAFRKRMVIAYYQEPEDNHTTPAARAEFRDQVIRLDELTEPYGVANGVQMQTYVIGPTQSHGGDQAVLDMVPAGHVDFFGWSLFDFNVNDSGPGHVDRAEAFMADHYAGTPWGITSLGFSVPQGTGQNEPLRDERAEYVENTLDAMTAEGSDASSWYDVPNGNENRDFGVDSDLMPVLVGAAR